MKIKIMLCLLLTSPAFAQVTSVNLENYQHTGTFSLPNPIASESSAVTYNWDNGNLFVVGDEGDALVEVNFTGAVVSSMTLTDFDDTEGLTYIGNGQFVLTEERLQDAYLLTYSAGSTVSRASLSFVSLGETVGNVGIEGISYDPISGSYFAVKEKTPQSVLQAEIDWDALTVSVSDLFIPDLGLSDLSDIQVLSTVPSLTGTADQNNLLIFSQESARLLKVSRTGDVLSQFDFGALSTTAEGVAIAGDGTIFVVDETPNLYVLSNIPEPSSFMLMSAGFAAAAMLFRGRFSKLEKRKV